MSAKEPKAGEILGPPKSEAAKAGDELAKKPNPADKTKTVVFKKSWKRWYVGDRAGFEAGLAKRLVDGGIASFAESKLKRAAKAVFDAAKPAPKATEPKAEDDSKSKGRAKRG